MNNDIYGVQDSVDHIVDVIGGADGGLQFAVFYHKTLPIIIQEAHQGNPDAMDLIVAIEKFERMVSTKTQG